MPSDRSFVTLDGLRGIAALAIVTRHAPDFFRSISINVFPLDGSNVSIPVGPFRESYLAVDFFFVLSGFVLAHAYGDRLRGGMSATRFMTIRFIRLYPLYFLALLISLVLLLWGLAHGAIDATYPVSNWLFAFLFLPSLASPSLLFPLNGPAWSLFYELLGNTAFGLIGRFLENSLLLLIVIFSGLTLLFAVYFGWLGFGSAGSGAMDNGFLWRGLGAGAARVAFSFFAGILVFRVWKVWHPRIRFNVPSFFVVAALIAILVANPSDTFQTAFDLVVTLFVFPCLIFLGASSVPSGLPSRLFRWVGAVSYAVYVLQAPLYDLTSHAVAHLKGGGLSQLSWTWGVAFLVFVVGVATIVDKYFDRPVREKLSAPFRASAKAAILSG
jgi:peptidoglycan/LPS O-acetylase OafA/YrhL